MHKGVRHPVLFFKWWRMLADKAGKVVWNLVKGDLKYQVLEVEVADLL